MPSPPSECSEPHRLSLELATQDGVSWEWGCGPQGPALRILLLFPLRAELHVGTLEVPD